MRYKGRTGYMNPIIVGTCFYLFELRIIIIILIRYGNKVFHYFVNFEKNDYNNNIIIILLYITFANDFELNFSLLFFKFYFI